MWIYWAIGAAWEVGYLQPSGLRAVEAYDTQDEARLAVHYLNGGSAVIADELARINDTLRDIRQEIEWAARQR